MAGQTVILRAAGQREFAKRLIDSAPDDAVVNVRSPSRSTDQNAKMWAMLSDVSRAKPGGRCAGAETWKALFMQACGHEVQFEIGLTGQVFPTGFRTSRLSKSQMCDLITFIQQWGDANGVVWTHGDFA